MEKQTCENCKWYFKWDVVINLGDCKRFPKKEQKIYKDFCGEYKPKKK